MKYFLFDLGGVLVELSGPPIVFRWAGGRRDEQEMWERWHTSETVRRFESGGMEAREFAVSMIEEYRLEVSPGEFLEELSRWPRGFYPGATDMLRDLRKRHGAGCLTNTNAFVWKRFEEEWGLPGYFDHCFASHLLGCVKPDREIFEKVLAVLTPERHEILFFDDLESNVRAAESCGIRSHLVRGFHEVKTALEKTGAWR